MGKKNKIFLILFVISFVFSIFLNKSKINIPYFGGLYKKTAVDVIFKKYQNDNIYFDNRNVQKKIKIDENHYLFYESELRPVKKIGFENNDNILNAHYYVGNKIVFDNNINNSKSLFDKICICFLAFFYNYKLFLFSYLFLFLILYNFKEKISHKRVFLFILFLGLFLRLTQINEIPFWDDEIYSLIVTSPKSPLSELFKDPGNPPLYFIFLKIFRSIFFDERFYRFSSVIFGIIFNISFYFFIKTTLNKKTALVGFFIAGINIPLIYFSQELRCYIFLMAFCAINSMLLFKFKDKNKFLYFLSSQALLYTHFYAFFIVLWNFIFGICIFFKNKKKLFPFIKINILTILFYIPLIIYKKNGLTTDFNSWMKLPVLDDYLFTIKTLVSCSMIIAILFTIVLLYSFIKIKDKKQALFLRYNFSMIIFTILAVSAFSYLIKPIFCYRYFYAVYLNYLAILCLIIYHFRKKIFFAVVFLILFATNQRINYQNLFCNHNLYFDYIKHDIDITKKNYIFVSDTIEGYEKFKIKGVENIYLPFNHGIDEIDIEKYNIQKPCTFYILNIYLDDNTLKKVQDFKLYKSPLGVFAKGNYK